MTGNKGKKKRKLTIWARIIGTCLLAFASGLLLSGVIYSYSQKFFGIALFEKYSMPSSAKVMAMKSYLDDYSVLENVSFPENMRLEIGRAVYAEQNTRGNHLIVMDKFFGEEERYAYEGVNKLASLAHRNGEVLILSDAFQTYRLAIKSAPCFYQDSAFLENRSKKSWIRKADPAFPYKEEGFFLQEKTEQGYCVIFEVEGDDATGYLKLEYDFDKHRLNRFLYVENNAVYSEIRAKETIDSATGAVSEVKQKDALVMEIDRMPEVMDITMVLEGHPYEVLQTSWKNVNVKPVLGTYETRLISEGENSTHEVVVCDTLAPVYKENEYIFFEGDKIDPMWIAENCFEDMSLPITVTFAEPEQEIIVTSDVVREGICNVPVKVTDAVGNSVETDVPLIVYDNKDLPEWFRFFMDYEDEGLLQRIRKGELEEVKEEYFEVYRENHWEDMYDEAVAGYKTAVRKGLDIRLEGEEWYGYRLMEIYAGVNDIPEHLLDAYIEEGWQILLCDEKILLGDMECAGITYYFEERIDITSYYDRPYTFRATMLHEFGHYVDYHYAFEVRDDEEFKDYLEWKREEFGLTEEELEQWYTEGCIGDPYTFEHGDYRHYSVVLVEEFFADSFFIYCAYPEKMSFNDPHIYAKMEELIEE